MIFADQSAPCFGHLALLRVRDDHETMTKGQPTVPPAEQSAQTVSDTEHCMPGGALARDADTFLIHGRALSNVLAYLKTRGVAAEVIAAELERQNLHHIVLESLDDFISMSRFAKFLRCMSQRLDEEALGLECVDFMDGGSMGVLGGVLVSAPNLASSVGALARYMNLYADLPFVNFTVGQEVVEFSWSYSPLVVASDMLCDRSVRLFVECMRHLFDENWRPSRVQLQREKPKDAAPYRRALCPCVLFGVPINTIEFPISDLLLENQRADTSAFELAVALAERMMNERRVSDDLSIRVREDILDHLCDGQLTVLDTAQRLGISRRVLQRRLAALGTSYQQLFDSTRTELAQELLSQTTLPMSEVAYRLGFSNQANLTRAVKRWFDVTPRVFRLESRI